MSEPRAPGRVRGSEVVATVRFLRARRAEARAALPAGLIHYLDDTLDESAWYPEHELSLLIDAAVRLIPGQPDLVLESMGESSARERPELYRRRLQDEDAEVRLAELWSDRHDSGELRVLREPPCSVRVELGRFAHTSRERCLMLGGYIKGIAAMAGFEDALVEKVGCSLWGDERCGWIVTSKRLDEGIEG